MHAMKAEQTALNGAPPLFPIGPPGPGATVLANLLNARRNVLLTHETEFAGCKSAPARHPGENS